MNVSASEATRQRKEVVENLSQFSFNLQSDLKLLKQCVFKVNGESKGKDNRQFEWDELWFAGEAEDITETTRMRIKELIKKTTETNLDLCLDIEKLIESVKLPDFFGNLSLSCQIPCFDWIWSRFLCPIEFFWFWNESSFWTNWSSKKATKRHSNTWKCATTPKWWASIKSYR